MGRRNSTKALVGLEIEPGCVTAARVSEDGRLAIVQAASAALDPHVVRDGEVNDVAALADALKRLWAEHKISGTKVRVGLASARVVIRTMDLPPVEDERALNAAVRFQAADELPMPLDAAVIDFHSLGLVETPEGTRNRVVVVAARRDMIERIVAAVRAAGLRPEGVDLSAFAMLRALQRADESAVFVAISGLTNLAISTPDGGPFTRVTGSGLEAVAQAVAERLSMPLDEVRGLVRQVGLEGDEELDETDVVVRAALSEGVRRVANEIRSSLDFHLANTPTAVAPDHVVLTGSAVTVPGFCAALSAELGLTVDPRSVEIAGELSSVSPAGATVAAGLAVEEVAA